MVPLSRVVLGCHIAQRVSFTPSASGASSRAAECPPQCSQHSVVAPSSNFNHNSVHQGALKTSQSVVLPQQSLPRPAVSAVKLPTSVIQLLFCKLILIVKSVLCRESHSAELLPFFLILIVLPILPAPAPRYFAVVSNCHFIGTSKLVTGAQMALHSSLRGDPAHRNFGLIITNSG